MVPTLLPVHLYCGFGGAIFSGHGISFLLAQIFYKCSHMPTSDVSVILPVILLSIGLIIDFYFHHKLIQEPVSTNPVSLIVRVMKYAARHKSPVQRNAFTYCENKLPTIEWIMEYGGPFTTEEVEDVKTLLFVILIFSSFNFALAPLFESATSLGENVRDFYSQTHCLQASTSSTYTSYAIITYSIPVYELLIYPCLRKRGPTILQSAGIGAVLTVSTSVYGMMVETYRQVA